MPWLSRLALRETEQWGPYSLLAFHSAPHLLFNSIFTESKNSILQFIKEWADGGVRVQPSFKKKKERKGGKKTFRRAHAQ